MAIQEFLQSVQGRGVREETPRAGVRERQRELMEAEDG
jgi:hypothetical protein